MKTSKFLLVVSILALQSFSVFGGTILITGEGEAKSPPDLYRIEMTVNSLCYETTKEAKAENSKITTDLITIAKKYQRNNNDELITQPGAFVRSTEYIPSDEGYSKILCEKKWKTWNTIRLTLHDIQSLPDLQNELVIFLEPIETVKPDKVEQTFVHLSSPDFGLTSEKQLVLRKEAQQLAIDDAREQLRNFDERCHFTAAKLSSLAPPAFTNTVRYGAKMADSSDSSTPVIPEAITVIAIWNFIWEFETAPGCYN